MMKIQRRTLVVGLGGTGCYSLRFAKERLKEYGALSKNLAENAVRFVPIDLDETSRTSTDGARIDEEFVQLLGTLVTQKIRHIDRPENSIYWEWYPDKAREVIKLRQAQVGAGQWRPLGRMAYCENQDWIETAIQDALRELESLRFRGEQGIDVILVSSLAGGTGSGTLLDVSYFIQNAALGNSYLPSAAFLLLPNIFLTSDVGHRADANSYAALKELACFYSQRKDFDIHYPKRPSSFHASAGTVIPYSNIFLFDSQLPNRTLASPRECFEYIGNMIFLRMVTEVKSQARSRFSNEAYPPRDKEGGTTLGESGFLFSSCSGALFILPTEDEVRNRLISTVKNDLASELNRAATGEPINASLEDWRQRVKESSIATAGFTGTARVIEEIRAILKPNIERAQKAIAGESTSAFRAESDEISKWDWDTEIDRALDRQFEVFQESLKQFVWEKPNSSETRELGLSTLTNRTRMALGLLEAKLKGLGPQTKAAPRNPAPAVVDKIKQTAEKLPKLRKYPWDRRLDVKPSLLAPQASKISRIGFKKATTEISELEHLFSSAELAEYIHWRSDQFLRKFLNRKIEELKAEISLTDRWLERFNTISATYGSPSRPKTETKEDKRDRKPLNIASISAETVVDGIQAARTQLLHRFDEDAMRMVKNISTYNPSAASSRFDESIHELMSTIEHGISEDVEKKSISMSQESISNTLREILDDAKVILFENLITNPCQESKVFYFRPPMANFFWERADSDEEGAIDSRVKQQIRQVFPGAQIEVGNSTGSHIVIYHETHYHPAANISSIIRLHQAYHTVPFSPACLHVHRDYAKLADLLEDISSNEVLCGNPKCDFNIINVPLDTYFCPNCDKPILNRCGNISCNTDNLLERLGGLKKIGETRTMCPGCNRNIQSFWWHCPRHGFQWREKNERYCLKCMEEVTKGSMVLSESSPQDRGRRHEVFCIRCKRERIDKPFVIPIPELYFDVPKHKVPFLLATLAQDALEGNLCPQCGAHLFPECPHSNGNGHQHFTVLGTGGRLTCNNYDEHGKSMVLLFQCYYCDFPLTGDEVTCPRCNHELIKCPNCIKNNEYRYLIPKNLLGHEQRCPVCNYEVTDVQE
jgi:hypothetical protein